MFSFRQISTVLYLGAPLVLVGCGGGAGGPGGPGGPATGAIAFSKFPLAANTPTKLTGKGREATFGSSGISAFAAHDMSADVTTDSDNDVTSVALTSGTNGTMTWDSSNSAMTSDFGDRIIAAVTNDGSRTIGVANPESADNQFEFQTYGAWIDEGTGRVGVFSAGAQTPLSHIPPGGSGNLTFAGTAGGLYHDGVSDDPVAMSADATLDVDFTTGTAEFATSGTMLGLASSSHLDMTGQFNIYGSASTVTTVDGMSGTIDGRFYGPFVEEIGGTFALTGNGASMAGGYGAVQQQP